MPQNCKIFLLKTTFFNLNKRCAEIIVKFFYKLSVKLHDRVIKIPLRLFMQLCSRLKTGKSATCTSFIANASFLMRLNGVLTMN